MRHAFPLVLLAACQGESSRDARSAPAGLPIACALAGASELAPGCTLARSSRGNEVVLTVTAPDGGFRRFAVNPEGGSIAAADGAEQVTMSDGSAGEVEVAVAQDRYRLPSLSR